MAVIGNVCNCDESRELRAELIRLRAESAYCRGLMSPAEIRQMELELADESEER